MNPFDLNAYTKAEQAAKTLHAQIAKIVDQAMCTVICAGRRVPAGQ